MRFKGRDTNHCHSWCGRPQFCLEFDSNGRYKDPEDENRPAEGPVEIHWARQSATTSSVEQAEILQSLGCFFD